MKKIVASVVICSVLVGCSTAGGMYKSGDSEHGQFSLGHTFLTILGVAAGVAAAKSGGGGGYLSPEYAWDYQPGNRQWVCRDASNGQYAYEYNCAGKAKIDNWP